MPAYLFLNRVYLLKPERLYNNRIELSQYITHRAVEIIRVGERISYETHESKRGG